MSGSLESQILALKIHHFDLHLHTNLGSSWVFKPKRRFDSQSLILTEPKSVTIQWKAVEQYFTMVLCF